MPLIVRGPGVPEGEELPHLVLNNDLAPTFADLADAETPNFVDGRSLRPLLANEPPPEDRWRSSLLIQAAPDPGTAGAPPLSGDPPPEDRRNVPGEWGRPGFQAVRTGDRLYVEYATGERELYGLREDPHQLDNLYGTADTELLRGLEERLAALRDCSGSECREAEEGPGPGPGARTSKNRVGS